MKSEEIFINYTIHWYKITDVTISFNNFLETIPLFKKEYKVSAIFIFNSWTKGNVIRFTLGNDWYQLGDTHPAVWMDTTGVRQTEISRGSIRSSPRNGLSTPYRLTVRTVLDCSTMFFSTLETFWGKFSFLIVLVLEIY